jgi:hypothetical protein
MTQRIAKLEALLARIKANAAAPRAAAPAAEPAFDTTDITAVVQVKQADDGASAHVDEASAPEREVEAPLESRARLVAAAAVEAEPEEIEAEDVMELDETNIVHDVSLASTIEAKAPPEALAPAPEDEGPPPSSRRPITEPAETPQEAQIQVAHTPPPESGKQVAADALSFDDDFTGVREAQVIKAPTPEASIQLQSMRSPKAAEPAPPDEMEVQLPAAPSEATRPPPGPLPDLHPPRAPSMPEPSSTLALDAPQSVEITRPTRPVAAAHVAEMAQAASAIAPKTFGELIDLALSL